jgi:hypothetical protein
MLGKLTTLPLRVPVRSAQLLTHVAGRALSVTGQVVNAVTGQVVDAVTPGRAEPARRDEPPPPAPAGPVADAPDRPVAAAAPPAADTRTTAVAEAPVEWTEEPRAPLVEEPAHVSEEPELVEESAEPGAEDGAGAGITVAEPWDGYGQMSAKDVIDRAGTATVAELATMRLYEARHRARQTVLAAVDRQLKLANGGRSA